MEKLSPLCTRKNTAARKVMSEMTLNTSACRMNGMVRRILKNSISGSLPCGIADRQVGDLAAMAVDEVDDGARHHDRREHRGADAQAMHHGEAAHGSRHHEEGKPDD